MEAAKEVKENGKNNNLTDLLLQEGSFPLQEEELTKLLNPQEYIGRSSELTIEFIEEIVTPLITSINKNNSFSPNEVDLKV